MKRKQPYMFVGATVLANEKKATITSMQENNLNGVDYVYYIDCKVHGEMESGRYHPNDVKDFKVENI
jgi:hypothetical protein